MSNIFGTSVSGLLAFQRALATTSHNISNVNTEGFSRQRVHLVTQVPHAQGGHFVGTGVVVSDVQRIFDSVRMSAVRTNTSEFQRLDAYHELSSRIDNLLADKDAGLSPAMQGLFEAVNEVANDPTSQTSRQVLLSEGQNLVSRFHFLDGRFDELERDLNARMTAQVSELNELAQGIAKLNKEIAHSTGRTGGTPNDLLDQRDHMITRMSGLVAVQTVVQNDGSINVSIGNGQPLVVGYKANSLEVTRNQYDKSRMDISFSLGSSSINVTHGIHGGSLGGMLTYRDEVLDPARRELGVLAATLATEFNEQHKLGMTFDHTPPEMGWDFFNVQDARVLPRDGTQAGTLPQVSLDIANIGELKPSDYELSYDGGGWTLRRTLDGVTWGPEPGPHQFEVDGLVIDTADVDADGNLAAGDSFMIQPTRDIVSQISLAIQRPEQVAAASPIVAGEYLDELGQSHNTGTANIGKTRVTSLDNYPQPPLSSNERLILVYEGGEYAVYQDEIDPGNHLGTIPYDSAADRGGLLVEGLPGYPGITVELSGVPEEGDAFSIESNEDGRGDNSNMLELAELSERATMVGGGSTYQEYYSSLVGNVGAVTMRAEINRDAQDTLLNQAVAAHEAVSGVNLDEEAANLMRFQQAYMAAAQAITISNNMFQSLLAAVGR